MQTKAILFKQFGSADELYLDTIDMPNLAMHEVLIKTTAAAVNPIDAKIRNGSSFVCSKRPDAFPWTLGFDFAGTVLQSGDKSALKPGDKVVGIAGHPFRPCAYAEHIVTDDKILCKVPLGINLKEAAALPTAGITALDILNTIKEVKPSGKVLILGASGGVGHLLLQMLKLSGYEVSSGASQSNFEFIKNCGADFIFDYHEDYLNTYSKTFDVAIDFVGGKVGINLYKTLKEDGALITVPSYSFDAVLSACPQGITAKSVLASPNSLKLEYLLKLMQDKKIKVVISEEFALDTKGARNAHRQIESAHTRGKIILVPIQA